MYRESSPVYVLDTSALIDMQHELWPMKHFGIVWANFNELAAQGRLLVFEAAKEECQDDELIGWFAEHPEVVVGPWSVMELCVKRVMSDLQSKGLELVNYENCKSDADPFVIACTMALNMSDYGHVASGRYVLVQHERSANNSPKKVNIPDVCQWYGVRYIRALDIVKEENWAFDWPR